VGDIILSIDGRITKRRNDITAAVSNRAPNGVMRLQVWRNGALFECALSPEAVPEARLLQRSAW
jgi:S1-C subfamily serine protease